MRAAAERVFNEGINAPAGVYSFAELAKVGTTCKTAPAGVCFREDYNADELININVDGYECSYPARFAFVIGYKFERLAKVGTKARAAFQRAADHGEPIAVFTLDATTCDSLAACADPRNTLRPALACVFVDLAAGLAVCCDSYIMNVTHIKDVSIFNSKSLINGGVLIPSHFAKAAKGCKVSIFKNDLDLIAVASNGNSCTLVRETYPDYKAVFEYTEKKAAAPVRLVKNVRELKKTAAAVAKVAACDVVYISGINGDEYITLSANSDGGEISRRVALSSGLTFNFATAMKVASIKSINNAADTLYISYFNTITFAGAKVVGLANPSFDPDKATATAAAAENIATKVKCFCNVYKDFTAPVVPADSIQTVDSTDTADMLHVVRRRNLASMFNVIKVAAVLLLVFVLRTVSTIDTTADTADTLHVAPVVPADSIQTVDSTDTADTLNIAPVVPADSIQTVDTADTAGTLHVVPVVPADSIQTIDTTADTADTLHVAPVVPADSIQTVDTADTADTLNVAPVAHVDSIQATEDDNADTLNVAPVAHVDSIQTTEGDNADTLDVAPVAPADSIQATEGDNADMLNVAPVAPVHPIL